MRTQLIQRLALAATLVAAAAGAQAAGLSYQGAADPYTSGSRSVQTAPSPYTDGARDVLSPRDPYGEGARTVQDQREPYTDGARTLAGMDRSGVSAPPARQADPYDGARQADGAMLARISNRDGYVADASIALAGSGAALARISNRDGYFA